MPSFRRPGPKLRVTQSAQLVQTALVEQDGKKHLMVPLLVQPLLLLDRMVLDLGPLELVLPEDAWVKLVQLDLRIQPLFIQERRPVLEVLLVLM